MFVRTAFWATLLTSEGALGQSFIYEDPSKPLTHYENLTFEPFKSLLQWGSSGKGSFWHQLHRQAAAVGLIMQKIPNKVFNVVNLTTSSAFLWPLPHPRSLFQPYIRVGLHHPSPVPTGIFLLFQLLTKTKQQQKTATSSSKEQS